MREHAALNSAAPGNLGGFSCARSTVPDRGIHAFRGALPEYCVKLRMEEWRAIPGFPDYEASSLGRIRRATPCNTAAAGFVLKTKTDAYGYAKVCIWREGKPSHRQAHRLVALAFLGEPPAGYQCAHGDGNRQNNALGNLRWATPAENAQDRQRHGLWLPPRGSEHHASTLTEADVIEIRRRRAAGERPSDLAAEYGVSRPSMSRILHRRTWTHL